MEVDTPIRGSTAPPDPQVECLRSGVEWWLQPSPEFAMKRLLAAGVGPIYQLCHVFREDEPGRHHQPEFAMLEWYRPGYDHFRLMDEVEALLQAVGAPAQAYARVSYREVMQRHAGIDPFVATIDELRGALERAGMLLAREPDALDRDDRDFWLDQAMGMLVAPQLGRPVPCFVYAYPPSQVAMARIAADGEPVAQRFELFWNGLELANGFHELGDAVEQRRRFEADLKRRADRGLTVPPMDERLLAALEHGLPNCAGVALGLDRLLMLLLKLPEIAQVQTFDVERA